MVSDKDPPASEQDPKSGVSGRDLNAVHGEDAPAQRGLEGRFRRQNTIAVGGMGELIRYRDTALKRDVVVKRIRAEQRSNELAQKRFVREVQLQAYLQHPCIVPVYDAGNLATGNVYFTMAHVKGVTLHQALAGLRRREPSVIRKFSQRFLLEAFGRLCLAIAYAHERGVLHRDIKPENIMLGDYGEVYILDWGVARNIIDTEQPSLRDVGVSDARVLPPNSQSPAIPNLGDSEPTHSQRAGAVDLTVAGSMVGTLEYMPPEQYIGIQSTNERTDVFTLGAILYEILTLQWFRDAETRADLALLIRKEIAGNVERKAVLGVSPELDAIWRKATAHDPEQRFQSARELHNVLIAEMDREREHERLREAAIELASSAALEVEQAPKDAADAETRRARALRSLGKALALDASQAEAFETLVNDLLEHPAGSCPEVDAEVRAREKQAAIRTFKLSTVIYAVWFGFLLVGSALRGVRSRVARGTMGGTVMILIAYNLWLWYRDVYERRHMLAVMVLSFIATSITSTVLGPFILLPSISASVFAAFAMTMRSDHKARALAMAMSLAAMLIPVGLQLTGFLPESYLYEHGQIVVVPGLVALPPHVAPAVLLAASVFTVLFANIGIVQVVDALNNSERSALTQAYRLRQLLPGRTSMLSPEIPGGGPSVRSRKSLRIPNARAAH